MKTISRIMLAGVGLGLAGCGSLPEASLGGTFITEPFINESIDGGSFSANLAREYQALADDAATNDVNWYDASAYARRGLDAAGGEEVAPWDPTALGVTNSEAIALYSRGVSLINANKSARPAECAKAQATWDHWLEELSEGAHSITDPATVKADLDTAIASCGPVAPAAADHFTVYFGFNKSGLNTAARDVVSDILAALNGKSNALLSLVGHADTVGSVGYNQKLSEKRAHSVSAALTNGGISRGEITESGRSELELAVPTADNVREPRNRRVEVVISQ